MKKILVFLLLFLSLISASAQSSVTPILRGLLQTDMNGGGKKITNLVDITDSAGNSLVSGSKVKLSATDTTPDYLLKKILKGSNITFTTNNPTGNATLTISSSGSGGSGTPLTDGTNTTVRTDGGGTNHVDVTTIPWSILTGVPTFQTGSANLTNLAGVSSNLFAYVSQLNTFSNLLGTASRSNGLSFYPITGNPSNFLITNGNGSLLTGITTSQISGLGTAAGSNGLSFYPITGNPSLFLTTNGNGSLLTGIPVFSDTNGFQRALQVAIAVAGGSNNLWIIVEGDILAATNRIVTDARNWSKLSIQQMSAINGNNYIADMLGSTPNYDGQFGQSYTGGGGRYINWLWASAGTSVGSNSWGVPLGIPGGINQIGEPRYDIPLATNTTSVHWYLNGGPHGQTRTNIWNGSVLTDAVWYFDNLNPWSEGMISFPMHTTNAAFWNAAEPFYTNSDGIKIGTVDQFGLTIGSIGPEDVVGETNQANSFNLILGETLTPFYISGNYAPFGTWTPGQYPWMGIDPRGLTNGSIGAGVRFPIWKNNVWCFTNANWKDALFIDEIGGNIRVGSNAYAQNLLITNNVVIGPGTGDAEFGSLGALETYDVNVWHALDVNNAVAFGYGPARLSPIAIGEKSGPPEFAIGSTATLDFSISDATDILNGNIAGQTWTKRLSMRPLALVLTNGLNLVVHDGTARVGGVATLTNAGNLLASRFSTNWNHTAMSNATALTLSVSNGATVTGTFTNLGQAVIGIANPGFSVGGAKIAAVGSENNNAVASLDTSTAGLMLFQMNDSYGTLYTPGNYPIYIAANNTLMFGFGVNGGVSVGQNLFATAAPANGLLVEGNVQMKGNLNASNAAAFSVTASNSFTLVTGAGAGKVLQSDANGVGTWQTVAGSGDVTQAGANSITNAANLFAGRFWTNWNWLAASNITASSLIVSNSITNIALTASRVVVSGANKELANATTTTTEVNLLAGETRNVNTLASTNLGNIYNSTNFATTFTNAVQYGIYTNSGQFTGTGNTNLIITLTNNTYYSIPLNLTNDVNFIQTTGRVAGVVTPFKYYIYPNGTNRNINVNTSWHIRGITTTTVLQSTNIGVLSGEFNGLGTSETNVFGDYIIY